MVLLTKEIEELKAPCDGQHGENDEEEAERDLINVVVVRRE